MKQIAIIVILMSMFICANGQKKRYLIFDGKQWGYIDKYGKTIIKPQFISADNFSEDLAAVRIGGRYGYIDTLGNIAIPPQYDLATSFISGQAKVFIDGRPFFIDKHGTIAFSHSFKNITAFENHSFAIATTFSDKYCLIDKKGNRITDTVFKNIFNFNRGTVVVEGLNHLPDPEDTSVNPNFECGVIDSNGNWVIPYGRYKQISKCNNGYACVERYHQTDIESSWTRFDALIDSLGNFKFQIPPKQYSFSNDNSSFSNGLAVVDFSQVTEGKLVGTSSYVFYKGIINLNGEIIFSDTNCEEITPIIYDRAFAKDRYTKIWKMINQFGTKVGDSTFEEIMFDNYRGNNDELFYDGYAFVKLDIGWYKIDINGVLFDGPIAFLDNYKHHIKRSGDFIFVNEDISVENPHYSYVYGFWNSKKNVMVPPTYHDINTNVIGDNLIYANKDGHIYYISQTGEVIWKQRKNKSKKTYLDIDFMNRGYYYASSAYKSELTGYGGWGNSDNQSRKVDNNEIQSSGKLQLIIDPNEKGKWQGYMGMKVYVTNASKDTIYFNAQDSRLYLKLQALNKKGEWQDIEYLPSSWCGNSYHMVYLASGEYWEFNAPIYHGEVKTKLRTQLYYKKTKDQEKEDLIYSNEIDGSINPGQFWNKRTYHPGGIMDPYND